LSSITLAELHYGVICAADPEGAREQVDLLVQAIPVLPFSEDAAAAYGPVRLASNRRKNDMMDKLIAAHAQALNLTLVTNNVADFRVYPGLQIENWLE
jgi:tRNA(fMet)-specific endonuclease VapC